MVLTPANLSDLSSALVDANAHAQRITGYDLAALNRVVEYTPEDMTVTVEAGITLAALQEQLRRKGQWLPLDPPQPERVTIGALIAANASGPRRFGYGSVREHVIGIRVALADGRLIKAGGKVVKNVAGYDLCKLFVGSRGTLGVIVEATFKVRPLPELEQFAQARCDTREGASALVETLVESLLTPVVMDLHNVSSPTGPTPAWTNGTASALVLGFAGAREDVEWQLAKARELGFDQPATLGYEAKFWADPDPVRRWSALPSRLLETVRGLGAVRFVARAGNGIVYYRGGPEPPKDESPGNLLQRVKEVYDPKQVLPELSL